MGLIPQPSQHGVVLQMDSDDNHNYFSCWGQTSAVVVVHLLMLDLMDP
ncbi:hypothetical protein CIB84_001252 [Bambusicola thoracicus]|uniref:Uncharacterized protein n=1 Tax=Bambusicola thoracicus TaxID=9083 RepID=A0A2P4TF72_BAMTH|nr:hypothetical protein CIB84_001252 [Bambusicola thoracicus]